MNLFSKLLRYLTFAVAAWGIFSMTSVLRDLHAQEKSIPPPPVAPPQKPYDNTVAGTGILEALMENVAIGVPQAGLVLEVNVKVNDVVKKGDPLFKMDDRELQAQLIKLSAMVELDKAKIAVQEATDKKYSDMLDRAKAVGSRAISMDEVQQRENDLAVGKAQLQASKAELAAAEADVKQTQMLVERLVVRAPRDGSILQVNIRAGEYAATSPKDPAMYMGNLEKLQVRADIDEQNATRIRPGLKGVAFIKGDTKNRLPLTFVRVEPYVIPKVSLTGASTERVDTRVLQVIYSLERPKDPPIYVGQQVDVYIDAGPEKHVP
jgi:RND family efflux transporter MFP subunit